MVRREGGWEERSSGISGNFYIFALHLPCTQFYWFYHFYNIYKKTLFFNSHLNEELSLHLLDSRLQPTSTPSTRFGKSVACAVRHHSPYRRSSVFLTPAPVPSSALPSCCFLHMEADSCRLSGRSVYLHERFI